MRVRARAHNALAARGNLDAIAVPQRIGPTHGAAGDAGTAPIRPVGAIPARMASRAAQHAHAQQRDWRSCYARCCTARRLPGHSPHRPEPAAERGPAEQRRHEAQPPPPPPPLLHRAQQRQARAARDGGGAGVGERGGEGPGREPRPLEAQPDLLPPAARVP
jgi:hypothetical protein